MTLPKRILQSLAILLLATFNINALAQAASAPGAPPGPYDKLVQKLNARGTGKGIKVIETNGTELKGVLVSLDSTGFQMTPAKATAPIHIDYAQVSKVSNTGLSTGSKVGIGVVVGLVVAAGVIAIIIAVALSKWK